MNTEYRVAVCGAEYAIADKDGKGYPLAKYQALLEAQRLDRPVPIEVLINDRRSYFIEVQPDGSERRVINERRTSWGT